MYWFKRKLERKWRKIRLVCYRSTVCQLSFCFRCFEKLSNLLKLFLLQFWKIDNDSCRSYDTDLERCSYQRVLWPRSIPYYGLLIMGNLLFVFSSLQSFFCFVFVCASVCTCMHAGSKTKILLPKQCYQMQNETQLFVPYWYACFSCVCSAMSWLRACAVNQGCLS